MPSFGWYFARRCAASPGTAEALQKQKNFPQSVMPAETSSRERQFRMNFRFRGNNPEWRFWDGPAQWLRLQERTNCLTLRGKFRPFKITYCINFIWLFGIFFLKLKPRDKGLIQKHGRHFPRQSRGVPSPDCLSHWEWRYPENGHGKHTERGKFRAKFPANRAIEAN